MVSRQMAHDEGRAVRTGTLTTTIRRGANHHHREEVVTRTMTVSCQGGATRKRFFKKAAATHHHVDRINRNMMMRLVVCSVLLSSCWTLVATTAFVLITPLSKRGHHQLLRNSPERSTLRKAVSRPQWRTTLRAVAAASSGTNDESSKGATTPRRRRSPRTVARASAMDSDMTRATDNGDPKRKRTSTTSRPKIRQTTLKLQQQSMPDQEDESATRTTATIISQQGQRFPKAAASMEGVPSNTNDTLPRGRRKTNKKKSSSSSEFSFNDALMKDHEILTGLQEFQLGRDVQRAKPLQLALERLLQEKRLEQQEQELLLQQEQLFNSESDDDTLDDDEDDRDYNNDYYAKDRDFDITQFSFAWQRREELEKASWLASCWQEGDDDDEQEGLGGGNINSRSSSMPSADTLLLETLMTRPPPSLCNENGDDDATTSIYITDEDVIRYMNLPGGRAELQSILWSGIVARDTLIRSNIRLVVSIAKKWARQQAPGTANGGSSGISSSSSGPSAYYNIQYLRSVYAGGWDRPSLDEAVQEGIVGLAEAVQRYDPSRKLRFSTYATFWITNSIRKCFQNASTTCLRVPASYHDIKSRFNTLIRDHYQMSGANQDSAANLASLSRTAGQSPSLDVLANELGITKGRLQRVLRATQPLLSLDQPRGTGIVKSDGNNQRAVVLSESLSTDDYDNGGGWRTAATGTTMEQGVELSFLRRSLENAMATELAPYERDIVRLRLGLDDGVSKTAKQVVAAYGGDLSETEVRLAEKRALSKLRSPHALSTYKFLAYFDFAGIDKETATFR